MKIIQGAVESSAKRGGGKLNRSETVTVRLDPKLNYLCELAARSQRRTKSSFIEWAVAESMRMIELPENRDSSGWDGNHNVTLADRASTLWHVDEADRLVSLALQAPGLLNHEEQVIWRIVREAGYFWRGRYKSGEWTWSLDESSVVHDRLRTHWEAIKQIADGELPISELPQCPKQEPEDELDDEVPF